MAEVFRALEPRPAGEPRVVVLKRMLPHIAEEPGAAAMFREEAELGSRVQHPNVVHVLELGESDGHPFLVLEYVPGCDLWRLSRFLRRQGQPLPRDLALHVVLELLRGLDAVHGATDADGNPLRIVHRDVSPSNVLISTRGEVKLGDFGIARGPRAAAGRSSASNAKAKGKIGYLAPEQVVGAPSDHRADLFAAGVIAAELLMGAPLFSGSSELAVLLAIRDARIERFEEAAKELPAPLVQAIRLALAPDPEARLPSAAAFAERLEAFAPKDPARTQRALGELVTLAQRAHQEAPQTSEPSLLPGEEATPALLSDVSGPPTSELPSEIYTAVGQDGSVLGRYSFAQLVEAIATGLLGSHDRILLADGATKALSELTHLARHLPPSSFTPVTRESTSPVPPDRRYGLAEGGIVRALVSGALYGESGLWLCENEHARKEIYVRNGKLELVASNQSSELLGEYLVGRGVLSRGELDMALAVMPRFEGRLGDTLVALGLLESVDVFQHIAAQGREKLLDLFLWADGVASFYRNAPTPPSGFPLGLDPWALVDEGMGARLARGLEEETFRAHMLDSLEATPAARELVEAPVTPPRLRRALEAAARPAPLDEVVSAVESAPGEASGSGYRAVVLLLHLEALRWAP
jgi:serine/threonine-protein kinase